MNARADQAIRWLHLSDLCSPGGTDEEWEEAARATMRHLSRARDVWGGIDAVLISGDIARSGSPREYARASLLIEDIQAVLSQDGVSPAVLAVPGEHDRGRPEDAFSAWGQWWLERMYARPASVEVYPSRHTGDFSATIALAPRNLRLGVVGINTATLAPAVLEERLRVVCGADVRRWVRHHHAAVVLAHRVEPSQEELSKVWGCLEQLGFCALHCGDLRESRVVLSSWAGMLVVQSPTFAGYDVEGFGGAHFVRSQGGVVAEMDFSVKEYNLFRVWDLEQCAEGASKREAVHRDRIPPDALIDRLPDDMPEALARAPVSRAGDDAVTSREEMEELLGEVLPDLTDFAGFTLNELPEVHRRFSYGMSRKDRLGILFDRATLDVIETSLRRYLPEVTSACLRELRARKTR